MATTQRRYSKEEFARRGDALFEQEIRSQLKAQDEGKFAAIDIESGEFAVDADEMGQVGLVRVRDLLDVQADEEGGQLLQLVLHGGYLVGHDG